MDLDLVKFVNSDLTWNSVRKGHRSMMRRPRKPGASSRESGLGFGHIKQDLAVFDYEKSGVAVLGKHFAEEVLDVPIKKRILMLQSPSLSGEGALLPQPLTPSPDHEESGQIVDRKHASGQRSRSNSPSNIWETQFKNESSNNELLKLTKKEVSDLNDFSGIELLAAAACVSSVCDGSDQVESSAVVEHTTPRVGSHADSIQENIAPMDSDDSSVQDNPFLVTQNLCDNDNGERDKSLVSSKVVRLHWDLNTVMDEWEEPCHDILVDPHYQKGYVEGFCNDGLQNSKANLEGYETRNSEITGGEQESMLHGVCANQSGKNDAAITCKTSDADSCLSKSYVVDSFVCPAKCENFSKNSNDTKPVSEVQVQVQVGCMPFKGDVNDKFTSEDRLSDCCGSNVSQDERCHMAEANTLDKAKPGYDSPFEDGELRDSIGYAWQKNEVEERDCVDYEYDAIYQDGFDTNESGKNEVTLDHGQTIGEVSAVPNNDVEQDSKADASDIPNCLLGTKASGYHYKPQKHSKLAMLEENDGTSGEFLKNRHDESRNLGANFLCSDRSSSFGVRKNGTYIRQSRSDNVKDCYSQNDVNGQRVASSTVAWDSRNSHGYPRPKPNGSSSSFDNNQSISYNPKGIYKTFNKRPSPSDRNESYRIHRGRTPPSRGVSRDRYRTGSGFHQQGLRRAPQEEYQYHDPEPCYSERKVRRVSPNFNRAAHLSRSWRRSRSRSRSGSPIAWHFQKRKNGETKRQSPDSRSDTRFPFRKPCFSSETEAGFVSPTRRRVSPQYISRRLDDRNIITGQIRTFQRNQKFEASGGPPRKKSNDNFRPSQRPVRSSQITGPTREHKYEDNENDNDKYGMINGGRRFRYDVDDSFKTRNLRNKDNGFRYTRNENRAVDFHKDDLQRE